MEGRQPETKTAGGRFGLSKPHKDLLPLPDGATGCNAKDEQMLLASASAAEAASRGGGGGGFRAPDGSSCSSRGVGGVLEDDKKRRMSPSFTSPPPSSSLYSTSPSSSAAARRDGTAAVVGAGGSINTGALASQPCCQAEKCMANLTEAKRYHRRHKVCEAHSKAPVVLVAGLRQRFCQQCSRFHELSEFDDTKRSCRRRLAGHNERRRKNSSDSQEEGSTNRCRQTDHNRKIQITMPGTAAPTPAAYKHFQIR